MTTFKMPEPSHANFDGLPLYTAEALRDVLEQALDALEKHDGNYKLSKEGAVRVDAAITAGRAALSTHPQASEPAPSTAARSCGNECDTPAYCKSVQRCTARDEKPAQGERAMQGLSAYLRCEAGGLFQGSPSHTTLMQWAKEVDSALQSTVQPVGEMTDDDIEALGHRMATKYTHRSDPVYHSYGFVKHTLIDFAREMEKQIKEMK
jgi:hypothetical protein